MECNKEEAVRAKEMAERKMESKDFVNAKKVAQKAQKLYPDLKDISQMILVCDVHCAAQNKVVGNENDWYGILQVEPTADETAIKKQYRRLALALHPDKNQLAGAADAFKFVGEAQKVLLDRERRIMYDRKCKASGRYPASNRTVQQGSRQPNPRPVHSWFPNPFPNNATQFMNQDDQQNNQRTQSGPGNPRPTFWTACRFCSVRYQFYKELVNKKVRCQNCNKDFLGCETDAPSGTNFSCQPTNSQQRGGLSQNHHTAVHQSVFKKPSSAGNQGSVNIGPSREKVFSSEKVLKKNRKKRNNIVESSESSDSDSSVSDGEDMNIEEEDKNGLGQNSGSHSERDLRRSGRSKQKVTYDENPSGDDDLTNPSKRSKSSESFRAVNLEGDMFHKKDGPDTVEELKDLQNGRKEAEYPYKKESVPEDDEISNIPESFEYPDPDFSDFDKERKEERFAAGQIWACYDTFDAMPRFYALIRKVQLREFKLQISWLEPTPDDKDEIKWVSEGLPVSCGKFRHGSSENCEDHGMFSQLASWEKGSKRNSYQIYPREGETWAIFKDWDINCHPDPLSKKKYEFEFVEVLSNYVDNVGVKVAYLGKLKGFTCLFCRMKKEGVGSFVIPTKQTFRFSHKVPSFRMTGEEGENVPPGSFELDPASLPSSHVGADVSENIDMVSAQNHLNGSCSKSPEDMQGRKNECPTQFVKKTAESEAKKPFIERVILKADAPQEHFQNPGSKGNATTAHVIEHIVLSDESESEEPELRSIEIPVAMVPTVSPKRVWPHLVLPQKALKFPTQYFMTLMLTSHWKNSGLVRYGQYIWMKMPYQSTMVRF